MKTTKKLIAVILTALMAISMMPFTASADTAYYEKVTESLSDWSGDYLIVYEDGNKAFNGNCDTSSINGTANTMAVTVSNGKIESNATTNAAKVTISKNGDDYHIKTTTNLYIGGQSGVNKLAASSSGINNSIAFNNGNVNIISNGCYLRYNTGATMFRYYKTDSQTAIQLYKLTTAPAPTHTHDDITFEPWESTTSLPENGSYYLTADVTLSEYVVITQELSLCLNGHTITLTGENTVIVPAYGGVLNLYDDTDSGSIIGGAGLEEYGGAIYAAEGMFNMYGGTITGGHVAQQGGAVYLSESSTFNMYGGTISDNEAAQGGGGVAINSSTFNMYGGTISDNEAAQGGGVYVSNNSHTTFNMYGGTISGNTAMTGGGVVNGGTFEMSGGTISGNTAYQREDGSFGSGGGVVNNEEMVLTGGSITANSAGSLGGGIYSGPFGTQNVSGGSVIGNTADQAANIMLTNEGVINIIDTLPADSRFGVALVNGASEPVEGVFTSGFSGKGSLDNFVNENGEGFTMSLTEEGEVQFTQVPKFSVFVKKLTGGTITVSNVTGLTTASQLKDLLVTETGVPASAMRLIYAGKQLADDKTLGEYNIQKDSTIHLIISTYTITWKSDEATIIDTTNVAYGETPTHAAPADYEDANYTYTFAGWTPEVTAVTGEATYVAQFTAVPKTPVLPQATVTDITESEENTIGLDSAFKFEAPEGTTAYDDYYCDFKISFDRDLTSDDIELWGKYGSYDWTNLASEASGDAYTIEKDTDYYLLRDVVQAPMTYAQIRDNVGTFLCGIKSHYGAAGATINVQLVLFEDIIEVNPITLDNKNFVAPTQADNGTNITVADTISENFYLDDEFYGEDAFVAVNYNHNSNVSEDPDFQTEIKAMASLAELSDATSPYDGARILSVLQAPAQSTETITINVYPTEQDAIDRTNAIGNPIEYSVYSYCRQIIEGEYNENLKALAKSTLDYAAASQLYFNYNTDNMATADNSGNAFYGDVADFDMASVTASASAPGCIQSFSVVVKSDLEINLLSRTPINVESANLDTTKGGERFAATSYQNGDWYVVHIAGIEPSNMDNTFTVVTDKGTISMSANAIIKMMANSGDEKLVTLAKAMYLYGAAANANFD